MAPGANDNASGVAAVLELARILSAAKYKATLIFALFSAEEIDRQGSRAFAAWVQQSGIDLVAMINLDTIGNVHDFNGNINDQQLRIFSAPPNSTSPSRKLAREINLLAYNYELDIELQVQDAIDRENRWGDHFSFSELDYPAVRFINAHEEKRNADPTDTIEFIEPGLFAARHTGVIGGAAVLGGWTARARQYRAAPARRRRAGTGLGASGGRQQLPHRAAAARLADLRAADPI